MEQLYELTCLLSPTLDENQLKELNEKIEKIIGVKAFKKEGGKKIVLAYPISKKNRAFLLSLHFKTDTENAPRIKNDLEKILEVLRFLLIKKQENAEKPQIKEKRRPAPKIDFKKPTPKSEQTLAEKTKKSAEMDQIEQELEKVLS